MQILDHLLRTSFVNHPNVFRDYFKDNHLYNIMVYNPEENSKVKLREGSDRNQIEFMNEIYQPTEEGEAFIKDNERWIHMYQLNTIELCNDLARKIMEDYQGPSQSGSAAQSVNSKGGSNLMNTSFRYKSNANN